MVKNSRKVLSTVLAATMVVGLIAPAYAVETAVNTEYATHEVGTRVENACMVIETENGEFYNADVYAIPASNATVLNDSNDETAITYVARVSEYDYSDPQGWTDDSDSVAFYMTLTYETSNTALGVNTPGVLLTKVSGRTQFKETGASVTDGFISATNSLPSAGVVDRIYDVPVRTTFSENTGFTRYVPVQVESHVCATWTATVTFRNSQCTVHYCVAVPNCGRPAGSWNE